MQENKGIKDNLDVYVANGGKFRILAYEKKMGKGSRLWAKFSSHSTQHGSLYILDSQGLAIH